MSTVTFKSFLAESDDRQMSFDDMIEIIKRDCKPWLDVVKNLPRGKRMIYRGMSTASTASLNKKSVRVNREPRHSDKWLHDLLNNFLFKKFGTKYRSEALFVTPSTTVAKGYTHKRGETFDTGAVYLIFPIGSVDYCFSETTKDVTWDIMANIMPELHYDYSREGLKGDKITKAIKADIEEMIEKNERFHYVENENIGSAFKRDNEIMIKCKDFYFIMLHSAAGTPKISQTSEPEDSRYVYDFEDKLFA